MSEFLRVLENEVQIAALAFMTAAYAVRVAWLLRWRASRERSLAEGSESAGAGYSLLSVVRPWAMESARTRPVFTVQFFLFHIGVAAAISATFIIPYAPRLFEIKPVVLVFQIFIGAGLAAGLMRLYRRLADPAIRLISTPDDYVSLVLMIAFFTAGILAVPDRPALSEAPLIAFFGLTAFFLVYVPFSKIGHYLYYPFTRFILGKTLGRRGVYPIRKPDTGGLP
jgi:nitrate reductase gamma subunit